MKIRQIHAFLVLAEHLHFRKAAQELGLTQAALSMGIQALEEEVGVKLLQRDRHVTRLTYAGEIFRADIGQMMSQATQATEHVRRAATGISDTLRVAFNSTMTHFLPGLVTGFRRDNPHIDLRLQYRVNIDQLAAIEAGVLDVGFIRLPLAMQYDIELITVHRERHVILVSLDDPLAKLASLQPRDIADATFIMYSRRNAPGYHDMIMHTLNHNGIQPRIAQEVGEMYTLVSLVSAGMGIAIAPVSTRNYNLPGVAVLEADWLPTADIAVTFRKHETRPVPRAFIDMAIRAHTEVDA